jgi:hypothetical protein
VTYSRVWYRILIPLSFLVWVFLFRSFLFGDNSLQSDALAYYEHFKFYLDQLGRGVYPLWDPTRDGGVPVEFYLRRIGSFNPLYLLILILEKGGLSFRQSYLFFLAFYYFLGCLGFYGIAKTLLKDKSASFLAFLLLLFSSLGTRLFDSYLLLTFVPGVWFFYFLIKLNTSLKNERLKKSKFYLAGLIFCLMITMQTYVPFYFLVIMMTFLLSLSVVDFKTISSFVKNGSVFTRQNRMLVGIFTLFLVLSILPGLFLFQEAHKGDMVLPLRHSNLKTENVIEVDPIWVQKWGIEEDIVYSAAYGSDEAKMRFAVLYIPCMAYLIFVFGMFLKINKRLILLLLWGLFIFFISAQHFPMYGFLQKHVFFFKYFRNLHFFLWLAFLPVFILFITEQFRLMKERWPLRKVKEGILISLILVVIAGESMFVYHHFAKNVYAPAKGYRYDAPYLSLTLPGDDHTLPPAAQFGVPKSDPGIYMTLKWFNILDQYADRNWLKKYLEKKLMVYDKTQWLDVNDFNLAEVIQTLAQEKNLALISSGPENKSAVETMIKLGNRFAWEASLSKQAETVTQESKDVQVIHYDVNDVKLRTQFDRMRFLVYLDGYHPKWKAFVNGRETQVVRANLAFKGIWVPKGETVVDFKYGSVWDQVFNDGLLIIFAGTFFYLMFACRKTKNETV